MAGDLSFALRTLRHSPLFSLTVLVTLALGVGANTAIFSVLHSVVLRSLPYPHSERIVRLYEYQPERDFRVGVSVPNLLDWKERATSFEIMEAFRVRFLSLDDAESRVSILAGGPALLDLIGVQPIVGRLLQQEDLAPSAPKAVLISHRLWVGRYGSDPGVVGRTLRLGGEPYAVIGVASPIVGPLFSRTEAIIAWQPSRTASAASRGSRGRASLGRLRAGVSVDEAQAELDVIGNALREQYPKSNADFAPLVISLYEETVSRIRPMLLALFSATVLILLIAVANIANLFLARGISRVPELSVRAALGAGVLRIGRLLLTESMLLAAAGGLAGIVLGWALVQGFLAESPNWIPRLGEIGVDGTVVLLAVTVVLIAGLLLGLTPLWVLRRAAARGGIGAAAQGTGQQLDRSRLRSGLVATQLALALVLLTGSALMIRSFVALQNVPLGIDFDHIVTFSDGGFSVGPLRDRAVADLGRRLLVLEELRALPGVTGATLTSQAPLSGGWGAFAIEILDGRAAGRKLDVDLVGVVPDFFDFFESRPIAGRLFQSSDQSGSANAVVVDANLAKMIWGDEPAVGKRVRFHETEAEVIGVSSPIRYGDLAREMRPKLYTLMGKTSGAHGGTFLIRYQGHADAIMPAIEARVEQVDPAVRINNLQPLEAIYDRYLRQPRFYLALIVSLGSLALVVAAVGVFGVVSYSVRRRTAEVGIRMALGADAAGIVMLFSRRTAGVLLAGLTLGGVASLWLSQYLESLLFEIEPTDPTALATMALLLAAVSMAATWIPTRRALRVDPASALRAE